MQTKPFRKPLFTLLILAPLCGEMMSGSQPPLTWINPVMVLLLVMLYGSGAVLIREFVRRWGQGWPSILLLGAAYGIYEEGLVVRSFFDPTWPALDLLATHGRWLGVNWIWTFNLTAFHTVVSIAIPILLVELIYPDVRHQTWVTRRGLKIHGLLFGSMLILGQGFGMVAPFLGYVGCALVIAALIWLARRWPAPDPVQVATAQPPRLRAIWGYGLLGMWGLFMTLWLIPSWEPPALISALAFAGLVWWAVRRARRLGAWAWGPREKWTAAASGLTMWIAFAFLMVAGPDMPLAGLLFVWILWRVRRRVWCVVPPPTDAQLVPIG